MTNFDYVYALSRLHEMHLIRDDFRTSWTGDFAGRCFDKEQAIKREVKWLNQRRKKEKRNE